MIRDFLTDILWEKIQIIMKKINVIDGKMIAMLYLLCYGNYIQAPWRDIPSKFCPWKTAYNRFNRWTYKNIWHHFFLILKKKQIKIVFL